MAQTARDTEDVDADSLILALVERGLSPAEAVDFYAVEIDDETQSEWAEARGLSGHQSVGRNVRSGRGILEKHGIDVGELIAEQSEPADAEADDRDADRDDVDGDEADAEAFDGLPEPLEETVREITGEWSDDELTAIVSLLESQVHEADDGTVRLWDQIENVTGDVESEDLTLTVTETDGVIWVDATDSGTVHSIGSIEIESDDESPDR